MIGAPNSLNLNCKVRVMKEAPGPSVSEEIADIFTNYNIDCPCVCVHFSLDKSKDNFISYYVCDAKFVHHVVYFVY